MILKHTLLAKLVGAVLTLMLQVARMLCLVMHIHCALILLDRLAVRAHKLTLLILEILKRHSVGSQGSDPRRRLQFFPAGWPTARAAHKDLPQLASRYA